MEKDLIILTGGKSSRMGTDKAFLKIGEETFVEKLRNEFSPYFENIAISVDRQGKFAQLRLENTEIVDIYKEIGPLSGIYSALKSVQGENIFVVSVDMPFASPQLALKIWEHDNTSDICVIKRQDGKLEPLFAKYNKNCISYMEEMIHRGCYKMYELFNLVNTTYIELEDSQLECLVNLNTKEDYERAVNTQ